MDPNQPPWGPPPGQPNQPSDPYAQYNAPAQPPNPYAPPVAFGGPFTGGSEFVPQAVGGWLLFLCVVLTILNPLVTVARFATELAQSAQLMDTVDGLRTVFLVDGVLSTFVLVFSVYAGTGLWSRRRGAVRVAKMYLGVQLMYALGAGLLPLALMSTIGEAGRTAMLGEYGKTAVRGLIFCVVWFMYLTSSKRVRDTYGPQG